MKCIRCGKSDIDPIMDCKWDIVTKNGDVESLLGQRHLQNHYVLDKNGNWIGLCPDCQLPEKRALPDNPTARDCVVMINLVSRKMETTNESLKTQEKRIAKTERELDRVWDVIRCLGEKER